MSTFQVYGYLTITVYKEIEANSEEEAREKALCLAPPELCYHCSRAGCNDGGEWQLDGWDDPPDDVIQEIRRES